MDNISGKCWLDDPSLLFKGQEIFPTDTMTEGERLNTLTRLVIVVSIIFYMYKWTLWWVFLCVSLIFIVGIWIYNKNNIPQKNIQKAYFRPPLEPIIKPIILPPKFKIASRV